MASMAFATSALLITLNLLFFTMVTSTYVPCPPPPSKIHNPPPSHPKSPPSPTKPKSPPSPTKPKSPPSPTKPTSPPSPTKPKSPPSPLPTPPPSPTKAACPPPSVPTPKSPPTKATCPRDTLKFGVCGNLLNDLVHIVIGTTPSKTKCCGLIGGLSDVDAAVCLCTAIKAKVLGTKLTVPVSLSMLLNYCGKGVPSGFQCA